MTSFFRDDEGDYDAKGYDGPNYEADRAEAQEWARGLLASDDWVILDTETTGVDYGSEPVSIGVLSPAGEVILDTLVWPECGEVPADAARIHGLTTEVLYERGAHRFNVIWPLLLAATEGKRIVAYNASFDSMIVRFACKLAKVPELPNEWVDAMLPYSAYVGHWHDYFGNYRWQRLPDFGVEGAHNAIFDCRSTLRVIQLMAQETGGNV